MHESARGICKLRASMGRHESRACGLRRRRVPGLQRHFDQQPQAGCPIPRPTAHVRAPLQRRERVCRVANRAIVSRNHKIRIAHRVPHRRTAEDERIQMGETIPRRRATLGDGERHVEQLGARRRVGADCDRKARHGRISAAQRANRPSNRARVARREPPLPQNADVGEPQCAVWCGRRPSGVHHFAQSVGRCNGRCAIAVRVQCVEHAKAQLRV